MKIRNLHKKLVGRVSIGATRPTKNDKIYKYRMSRLGKGVSAIDNLMVTDGVKALCMYHKLRAKFGNRRYPKYIKIAIDNCIWEQGISM